MLSSTLWSPLGQLPNLNNRNRRAWKAAELLILVWTTGESRLTAKDKTYLSAHTLSHHSQELTHIYQLCYEWWLFSSTPFLQLGLLG